MPVYGVVGHTGECLHEFNLFLVEMKRVRVKKKEDKMLLAKRPILCCVFGDSVILTSSLWRMAPTRGLVRKKK